MANVNLNPNDGNNPFAKTPQEIKRKRIELGAQFTFLMMTMALVIPMLWIMWDLAYRASDVLSYTYMVIGVGCVGLLIPYFLIEAAKRNEHKRKLFMGLAIAILAGISIWIVCITVFNMDNGGFDFLTLNPKKRMTAGGVWAPLIGTFLLVLLSLIISAPIGILAGVYLSEFATDNWFTRIINLAVVNLAGVPSIVHGLFGVGAFVYFMDMGRSLLAASSTVAVMTLPVIITSTKEALSSVPQSFRAACWNMGATKWQTIRTIVLPNSISGILTGVILQVARAAGETAPILFTGALDYTKIADTGFDSFVPYGIEDRLMALSYHLFTVATQVQDVPESFQFGTAVVLIGMVLMVNSISIGFRIYLRARKRW